MIDVDLMKHTGSVTDIFSDGTWRERMKEFLPLAKSQGFTIQTFEDKNYGKQYRVWKDGSSAPDKDSAWELVVGSDKWIEGFK